MSEKGQWPITTPGPVETAPGPPRARRRYLRRLLWGGSGLLLLLIVGIVGLYFWASSSTFENIIRKRLIARIEAATGGRAEIASFHWNPLRLQAEADGLVLHGREAEGEAPFVQLASMRVDVDVFGFWSPRVLLRDLDLVRPQIHLIVYPDGTTNQPQPHKESASHPLDTLFDLQANRVEVEHGSFDYDNRSDENDFQERHIALDFAANDAAILLRYVPPGVKTAESYHLDAGVRDLRLARGPAAHPEAPPVHGYLQAAVDFTRNTAYLRSLRLTAHNSGAPDRVLDIAGELTDINHPRWKATVQGELDLRVMEPALGFPQTPEGIARLNLAAQGQSAEFRVDGSVHAENASYIGNGVVTRGVGLDARVHADPLRLQITNVTVRLKPGGQLEGDVLLDHWLSPLPGMPVIEAAAAEVKRGKNRKAQTKTQASALPAAHPHSTGLHTNGKVNAYFRDVALDTVLDMVSYPPYQRLGLNTHLNGPSNAVWNNGDEKSLVIATNFALSSSSRAVNGEAATSGAIDATYFHRDGSVDLRNLQVTLPASQITARGRLGAYPISSPTGIAIEFQSHDLREFDTLLRDLGFRRNGATGAAALPVALNGEANFRGSWTGSLVDPHLAGDLSATNLMVTVPPANGSAEPRPVYLDTLNVTGSYSAGRIAIDHSQIQHGDAAISVDGTLTAAASSKTRPGFDESSLIRGNLRASGVNAKDLAPFFGQELPVTGLLSAQLAVDGPVGSPDGTGWVQLDRGSLYAEPVTRGRAQGKVAGRTLELSAVTLNSPAGTVTGSGSYDLRVHSFQVQARAAQLDVAKIQRLRDSGARLTGALQFSGSGTGTLDDPQLEARASLDKLTINGEQFGALDAVVHTANQTLSYNISSRFQTAQFTGHGQTALRGDNQTQATVKFSNFNIGALLEMEHLSGLTGESNLEGTVTLEGPLAKPELMHGEARIQELAVTIAGVHLRSENGLHATMQNSQISVDPMHVTGEATDLNVKGGLNLLGKRKLDVSANGSINLKLVETIDPDLTASGTTTFRIEAHGPLENPALTGRIDFENASLALEDLPNSLSQLHGTLEFNQNRLEVKSLTAMSGGGLLSVSGYLGFQNGLYANLALKGQSIRIRYPQGVSSAADINLQLQGPQNNLLLSGNVMITRFTVSPDVDLVALTSQTAKAKPIAPVSAPSNHVRLDVRIQSSPQLNFKNAFAKLAGDVDLRLRGTVASPSLLGRVSVTEGSATIAGTRYELQRGEITFTNPVRIQPTIDLNATARVEDYDITLGMHGSIDQMNITYRSDPPLPEADVIALLTLGRTQDQQRLYMQQQEQLAVNPASNALLGGALNATVSSRVQKLFGAGSVKVDPNHLGALGNSTTRITVEEQLGKNLTFTYATDVDTTAQQLLQAEIAINRHVSLLVARDESGVFSMVLKATRRFR
ncbi:MAG TPA: translocation/assembly module TamB domain-containing protein [Terracidiphilus sp.]|nr:translocation/assembly module TamB domain-containing protein [Terracidiphilus sp.]